jgi:hypothetical protein
VSKKNQYSGPEKLSILQELEMRQIAQADVAQKYDVNLNTWLWCKNLTSPKFILIFIKISSSYTHNFIKELNFRKDRANFCDLPPF